MIVCATERKNKRGKFFLSVYFDQGLRDVEIKRVFHPDAPNTKGEAILPNFIPEEAEKIVSQTPLWKI